MQCRVLNDNSIATSINLFQVKCHREQIHHIGNLTEISTCEKQKNRENTCERKQSNAQDNIYMVRQFHYVHGVAGISLLSGKNTKVRLQYFSLPQKTRQQPYKTLITKVDSTMG